MTRGQKALVALVVAMGVLIVVGTTALLVVVVHRIAHPRPAPEPARPIASSDAASAGTVLSGSLGEPDGTRIVALAPEGSDVLAIALSGGGRPDRVVVWDRTTGGRLDTVTVGPSAVPPR